MHACIFYGVILFHRSGRFAVTVVNNARTLICCVMLPAGTPKIIFQAEQGVSVGGGAASKKVAVRLRFCVGLLTDKCRSPPLPKGTQSKKQTHGCREHRLVMPSNVSNTPSLLDNHDAIICKVRPWVSKRQV